MTGDITPDKAAVSRYRWRHAHWARELELQRARYRRPEIWEKHNKVWRRKDRQFIHDVMRRFVPNTMAAHDAASVCGLQTTDLLSVVRKAGVLSGRIDPFSRFTSKEIACLTACVASCTLFSERGFFLDLQKLVQQVREEWPQGGEDDGE